MDIMRPKLIRVGDMCFRRLDVEDNGVIDDYNDILRQFSSEIPSEDNNNRVVDNIETKAVIQSKPQSIDVLEAIDLDESEDNDIKDISCNGSRFQTELTIGRFFFKFIVGQRGQTKAKIEGQTQTRIRVPNQSDTTGNVVITGSNRQDIKDAKRLIEEIVINARKKTDFTHFVSICFNYQSICDSFHEFKSQILNDSQTYGVIDESLFQKSNKLHVTVVPLLLTDQNDRQMASKILNECLIDYINPLTKGLPIRVRVEGIDYFNDDPSQVNVIFAKVVDMSDNQCLQSIVDHLYDKFKESGLISGRDYVLPTVSVDRKVKMHVTLMNTLFRPRDVRDRDSRGRTDRKVCFDATNIVKHFGNYCFGETDIEFIDISIRHSYQGRDGYYTPSSRIQFTSN